MKITAETARTAQYYELAMGCVRVCSVPFVAGGKSSYCDAVIATAGRIVPQLQCDCTNLELSERKSFHQGSRGAMQQFYFRDRVGPDRAQTPEIF
jgi:hypothetical protein